MKRKWINELKENDLLADQLFLVLEKATPMAKNNKQYMTLKLSDKTGVIEARLWDNVEKYNNFSQGDFIKVTGIINNYRDNLQLVIKHIENIQGDDIDLREFVQSSEYDTDEMLNNLFEFINSLEGKYLKKLLFKIFKNQYIIESYKMSPAGTKLHHAFLSGLLEHSLSVTALSDKMVTHYKDELNIPINRDLVIAGALLHDIGKIYELDYEKGFKYTTEGQLIGHVVIGYQLMNDMANLIEGFPYKVRMHLGHIILSHQGRLEFGSPKTAMSIEAFIVHCADELDSKINMIRNNIPYIDENNKDKVWSPFLKNLDSGYAVNSFDDISKIKDGDISPRRKYLDLENKKIKEIKDKKPIKTLF
jgi:3'-5' exoribonuclease